MKCGTIKWDGIMVKRRVKGKDMQPDSNSWYVLMTQTVGQFTMAALVMQGQHARMFERDVTECTSVKPTACHIAT